LIFNRQPCFIVPRRREQKLNAGFQRRILTGDT